MKNIEIIINGKAYPCRPSMGAMLRFKQETGKEITEIDPKSFTELCVYLWCCVKSASSRAGMDFDYSLMDFADNIDPTDMAEWSHTVMSPADGDAKAVKGEKKRR